MTKIKVADHAYYPMPTVLVGTQVEGRANFLAVAWVSRVNFSPPMMAAALGKTHHTNKGIHATGAFSINIPSADLLAKVDYCGIISGAKEDKSSLFTVTAGPETGAPLIEECPVTIECKLTNVVDLPADELFIGQVVGTYADPACCVDGKPEAKKIGAFMFTMPDNQYWSLGEPIGKAWSDGKKLCK